MRTIKLDVALSSVCVFVYLKPQVEATSFTTAEGLPSAYLGCPHPQAFLDSAMGATVSPLWHLGPCALLTEVVDLAPLMFAVGPEYTGFWTAESPLDAMSSAIGTRTLRHLQVILYQGSVSSLLLRWCRCCWVC